MKTSHDLETTGQREYMRAFAELSGAAGLMLAEIDTCGHDVDPAYRTTLYEAWEKSRQLLSATPQPPKPAGDVPLPMFPIESEGSYWSTTEIEVIRAYGNAREAAARDAGRADAVPAWFCELPAPISNPEAWPANYAGGYNDALNMCYDVIRGHAPQPMTTQGEAVENVDHFSSLREAVLAFDENPNGQNSTAVIMRARRLTGSQP